MIDRRGRRHVYGVGECPAGELVSELGGLATRPPKGSIPVWLTSDGRVVTESMPPGRRPSLRAVARWVGEPKGWADDWVVRLRAMARRTQISLQMLLGAYPRPAQSSGEPVGFLGDDHPAGLALYGAVHPVTGDQLLTTTAIEAERLGYEGTALLGHLAPTAPVTGALGLAEADVPWATRTGHVRGAQGKIDTPLPGDTIPCDAFMVTGWALWPPEPLARVEIAIDGAPAGCARIGLPRPDVARGSEQRGRPDASISGFEFPVAPSALPEEAAYLRVDAVIVRTDGERSRLPGVTVALEPPNQRLEDLDGRTAGLRARVEQVISRSPKRSREGLRILAFTHRLGYGGAQRYFVELLKRLVADPGVSCTVVSPDTGPYTAVVEALGIPVHVTGGYGGADADAYEGRMLELAAWAAPQSFDLAWVNCFDSYPGADLATRLEIPVVWSIHESFDVAIWWAGAYGPGSAHPYARDRAEAALRDAGALVFAADATRRQYERHCSPERMLTFPYGIELDEIARYRRRFDPAAARERLGIAEDATVVLSLGTIEPRKGQALLAQAFARVCETHPTAQLVLVGDQRNTYSDGLHEYLERSEISDRIRVVPLVADPYEWHGVADLFVLASDLESSPIVILEAMAFETPVVATGVFGVPELIEPGVNGYLCEPSDLDSLGGALDQALSASPESRRKVGEAGAQRVWARHDAGAYETRMRSLMTGLAADPEARPAELLSAGPRPPTRRSVPERVSVLIPTLDAGEGFERSLDAVWAQEGLGGLEIVVADSGSSDDTVEVARRAGARVEDIPRSEFNHGRVRNLLAGIAEGDVLLATVQDATLLEPTALFQLVQALRDEPGLAAISATQTAGEGADLFSLWHSWLHLERSGAPGDQKDWSVDNVCAAVRRSAWEQLRFRELDFAEDLDFGLRAHAAGWTSAFSRRALVAHHHDRPADHALSRGAVHRFALAALVDDLERHPVAELGLEALLAATPTVLGELQAVFDRAMPEGSTMSLGRCLRRISDGLRDEPQAAEASGELALLCELCAGDARGEGAVPALRDEVLASMEFPWLSQFALSQLEQINRREAEAFVARFTGSNMGQVLGDAMRDAPDSDAARRLHAAGVSACDERRAGPNAAER